MSLVSGWQGVLNPLIERRAGDWYPAQYVTGSNMRGAYGYRVGKFISSIALLLSQNIAADILLATRNCMGVGTHSDRPSNVNH